MRHEQETLVTFCKSAVKILLLRNLKMSSPLVKASCCMNCLKSIVIWSRNNDTPHAIVHAIKQLTAHFSTLLTSFLVLFQR